jgi:hypothetical protein
MQRGKLYTTLAPKAPEPICWHHGKPTHNERRCKFFHPKNHKPAPNICWHYGNPTHDERKCKFFHPKKEEYHPPAPNYQVEPHRQVEPPPFTYARGMFADSPFTSEGRPNRQIVAGDFPFTGDERLNHQIVAGDFPFTGDERLNRQIVALEQQITKYNNKLIIARQKLATAKHNRGKNKQVSDARNNQISQFLLEAKKRSITTNKEELAGQEFTELTELTELEAWLNCLQSACTAKK